MTASDIDVAFVCLRHDQAARRVRRGQERSCCWNRAGVPLPSPLAAGSLPPGPIGSRDSPTSRSPRRSAAAGSPPNLSSPSSTTAAIGSTSRFYEVALPPPGARLEASCRPWASPLARAAGGNVPVVPPTRRSRCSRHRPNRPLGPTWPGPRRNKREAADQDHPRRDSCLLQRLQTSADCCRRCSPTERRTTWQWCPRQGGLFEISSSQ